MVASVISHHHILQPVSFRNPYGNGEHDAIAERHHRRFHVLVGIMPFGNLLSSGLFFLRCFQKVDGYDRQSEGVVRITSNTLSPSGKGRFCLIRTEYRGHSAVAIYLCIAEKNMSSDGQRLLSLIKEKSLLRRDKKCTERKMCAKRIEYFSII